MRCPVEVVKSPINDWNKTSKLKQDENRKVQSNAELINNIAHGICMKF